MRIFHLANVAILPNKIILCSFNAGDGRLLHTDEGLSGKLLREISNELRLNLFYDPEWNKEEDMGETVLREMQENSVM